MIVMCAFCDDFRAVGPPEIVLETQRKHVQKHHPDAPKTRRKAHRHRAPRLATDKTVAENIANARKEGGATWASRVA